MALLLSLSGTLSPFPHYTSSLHNDRGHISGQADETCVFSAKLCGYESMMWSMGGQLRQKKIGWTEANQMDWGKLEGLRQIVMCESADAVYCIEWFMVQVWGVLSESNRCLSRAGVIQYSSIFHKPIDGTISINIGAMEECFLHDIPGLQDAGRY